MKTKTAFSLGLLALTATASAVDVRVTITSNAPTGGAVLTPVWVGFHDGSFDSYNGGLSTQLGLEQLAEVGMTGQIDADFQAGLTYVQNGVSGQFTTSQTTGRVSGTIATSTGAPPLQPGETTSSVFDLTAGSNQFFSYASMVLPTNDYYVANGNPEAFDINGIINGTSGPLTFNIGTANTVNDAGTEDNDFDFSAGNGLFPGLQMSNAPGGNTTPGGVNANVTGPNPFGSFANAPAGFDFSQLDFNNTALYPNGIATITIERIPEPSSLALTGLGALALLRRRRK